MDIAAGTINPMTGVAVATGDVITVFTYNSASGTWVPDTSISATGEVTVQQDATGLYVKFTADHFSYWNLGYRGITCTGTINLTSSNGTDHLAGLTFKATATSPAVGTLYSGIKPPGDPTVIMRNVPNNYQLTVNAYYGTSTTPVGTTSVAPNCKVSNPMIITLPVTLVTYTWLVERKCYYPPKETQPVPNVTVWSCPPGTTTLQPFPTCTTVAATNANGTATVQVPNVDPPYVLFFQPSDASQLSIQRANANSTPAIIDYISKTWEFCTVTGGSSP
jgi:hypothetical protein